MILSIVSFLINGDGFIVFSGIGFFFLESDRDACYREVFSTFDI